MKKEKWHSLGAIVGTLTAIIGGSVILTSFLNNRFITREENYIKALRETRAKIESKLAPTRNIQNGLVKEITEHKLPVIHESWNKEYGFFTVNNIKTVTGTEFRYRVLGIEDPENSERQIRLVCPKTSLFQFEVGKRYNFKYRLDNNGNITSGEIIEFGTRPVLDPRITGYGWLFEYELKPIQPDSIRADGILTPISLEKMKEVEEQGASK